MPFTEAPLSYVYNTYMMRKLTITVSDEVYQGLHAKIGQGHIGKFLESLARPHVVAHELEQAYKTMAADRDREAEAIEWSEALIGESFDETR